MLNLCGCNEPLQSWEIVDVFCEEIMLLLACIRSMRKPLLVGSEQLPSALTSSGFSALRLMEHRITHMPMLCVVF